MSTAAEAPVKPATFTVEHYEHMVECGAFDGAFGNVHVELIRGRILEKHTGKPARFSVDHFEHMVDVGAFDPPYDLPVELIQGEIVMMSPSGPSHSNEIDHLNKWSMQSTMDHAIRVRIQNPIRIPSEGSEPEPDICWVREREYSEKHPEASDVLLVIEVAGSSLAIDRGPKLATYAAAGIPEYWIVNLTDEQIEVYRRPSGKSYQDPSIHRVTDAVHPLALPAASLEPQQLYKN